MKNISLNITFTALALLALALPAAHAQVIALQDAQATNASILYQYSFEGSDDAERLGQKISPNTPALVTYSVTGTAVVPVSFVDGLDDSGTAIRTSAGAISGGVRNSGSAVTTTSNITYTSSGTIEFLVKADLQNDGGYAVAGTAGTSRWRFFQNGATNSGGTALTTIGNNVPLTLMGGSTGVAYNVNEWYYVAQTWNITGTNVTINGWVANLSAETPQLVQTIVGATHGHTGNFSSDFRIGSLTDTLSFFRGEVDAVAIYGSVLSESTINDHFLTVVPEPSSMALLLLGGLCAAVAIHRRRNRA